MFKDSKAFSSFSVLDLDAAEKFYGETLNLNVSEEPGMGLKLRLASGGEVFLYPKDNHEPATFTVLNFPVDNIDKAVEELASKGVQFERYEGFDQDDKGIARSDSPEHGPNIAWFKDPAGNILAVMQ